MLIIIVGISIFIYGGRKINILIIIGERKINILIIINKYTIAFLGRT